MALEEFEEEKKFRRKTKRMHDLLIKELELKDSANSDPQEYV
jgi:hypothetical protein